MSARAANGHAAGRSGGAGEEGMPKTGRHGPRPPRVTVSSPRISVVESPEPADRVALDTAITLFVKWAIRAHERANPAVTEAPEAPIDHHSGKEAPEAPTDHPERRLDAPN